MKLLSVAIPCYNSENYMEHCIQTLLTGGEEVEILIVDDGSAKDRTPQIADDYARRYPHICRAIHQENGGHGAAVNAGLKAASGTFFKVVDSDDWVNEEAYQQILEVLRRYREPAEGDEVLDMLVSNFVYEKEGARRKKVMNYRTAFPKDELFSWEDVRFFMTGQYILMHSVIYRTQMLKDCHLTLPEHTFYVDNIFVYHPLPYVRRLYYLDVNFYRYYIGRSDQSVNEKVMTSRIDQQIKVNKIMIDAFDLTKIRNKKLRDYMVKYLAMMMTVSSVFLIKEGSEESLGKRSELWRYLKNSSKGMYRLVNKHVLSKPMQIRGKAGRKMVVWGYRISRKLYGFN